MTTNRKLHSCQCSCSQSQNCEFFPELRDVNTQLGDKNTILRRKVGIVRYKLATVRKKSELWDKKLFCDGDKVKTKVKIEKSKLVKKSIASLYLAILTFPLRITRKSWNCKIKVAITIFFIPWQKWASILNWIELNSGTIRPLSRCFPAEFKIDSYLNFT